MDSMELISISQACEQLHTTARTLRFYEDQGLIESIRTGNEQKRFYDLHNLERIKLILFLRSLNLSIAEISSLLKSFPEISLNSSPKELISFLKTKNRQINQESVVLMKKIHRLEQAIISLGGYLTEEERNWYQKQAQIVANALLQQDPNPILEQLSESTLLAINADVLDNMWEDLVTKNVALKKITSIEISSESDSLIEFCVTFTTETSDVYFFFDYLYEKKKIFSFRYSCYP